MGWGHRRNQLYKFFLKIGSGIPELEDTEDGISHWKRSSPLQQCCATAQTVIWRNNKRRNRTLSVRRIRVFWWLTASQRLSAPGQLYSTYTQQRTHRHSTCVAATQCYTQSHVKHAQRQGRNVSQNSEYGWWDNSPNRLWILAFFGIFYTYNKLKTGNMLKKFFRSFRTPRGSRWESSASLYILYFISYTRAMFTITHGWKYGTHLFSVKKWEAWLTRARTIAPLNVMTQKCNRRLQGN